MKRTEFTRQRSYYANTLKAKSMAGSCDDDDVASMVSSRIQERNEYFRDTDSEHYLCAVQNQFPPSLEYVTIYSTNNNMTCQTLINSGSSKNYMKSEVASNLGLKIISKSDAKVVLADSKVELELIGIYYPA